MSNAALLTPNEVAALADASKTVVEKALEQKALRSPSGARANGRLLPLHAVALAVAVKSPGSTPHGERQEAGCSRTRQAV